MNIISQAVVVDVANLEYQAKGRVIRVYDTNDVGWLLPVEFSQSEDNSKFTLSNTPHGQIMAEVEI